VGEWRRVELLFLFFYFLLDFLLLEHYKHLNRMQLKNNILNLKDKVKHKLMYIQAIISLVKS